MLVVMLFYTVIGVMCGLVAHVFCNVLLYEDILNWYGRLIGKLPSYLAKPLGLCSLCFAGQFSLWATLYFNYILDLTFNPVLLIYTVSLAIYTTKKF